MSNYPVTLLYDGNCPLCCAEMNRLAARNRRGQLRFIDAAAPDFRAEQYGTTREALMRRMHGVRPDGTLIDGVDGRGRGRPADQRRQS